MSGPSLSTTIPASIQQLIDDYIRLVTIRLPDFLDGFYLHGSLALDAFNPRFSDIDFVAVVSRRCAPSDYSELRAIHEAINQQYPRWPLEGSYLQWDDLGQSEATITPHPHIHDGILHPSGYHDINAVTWWLLKHRGVAILGPAPDQLDFQVDWDDLIAKMHQNMNSYWARFTTNPRRLAWLLSDYGVQWAVLGVLRQFYTFREHDITSKTAAGIYALRHTPRHRHQLIQEALSIRAGTHASSYRFRVVRAIVTRAFVRHVIDLCNAAMI
jgi:hypothetical protein